MAMLSKACKPDNFESHYSLKLSFMNIWDLRLNFVDCKSFLESNSPDILALCETNLNDSIDSGNFSVRGYFPLIQKACSTHVHSLAVYVKEGLPFAQNLSIENSADSYLCFQVALLHSVSDFFFLYWSPSLSLCMVFDSISSNIKILIVLLFLTYFFLLTLVLVLQWFSLHWEILIMLLFHWLSIKFTIGCLVSSHSLWLSLSWLG